MEQTSSGKNFTITSQEEVKGTEPPSFRRWLVLATGFFVMFLATGFAFNLAVLIPELFSSYGKSKAETALVQSITAGMLNIGGTPCGKSVSKYGARVTGIAGSLLVTIGLVCSFFSTRIPHLVVTLGIISGFGFSAVFVSSLTSVGEYFEDKSKLMALAFITFGSGCGGILVPFILDMLINEYGWKGSLLLMGGLMTHMICFFAVCKPIMIGISTTQDSENETSSHRPFVNSLKSLVTNAVYIIHVIRVCFTIPAINSSKIFIIDYLNTNGFKSTSC
ncbi:monocarboxylate transporter 6-like [Argopecten irradians]|uniref:monocarboxylate transporter 6-like n=1 Tax=Argopecten irradians TaxID=31199 RepID=UPI0037125751